MKLIACTRQNCFQNIGGCSCKLLNEGYEDADNEKCPFFKTQDEVDIGRIEAHQKLLKAGRKDLIETYEYNPQRRGLW